MATQRKVIAAVVLVLLAALVGGLYWGRVQRPERAPVAKASRAPARSERPPSIPAITIPTGEIARDDSLAGSVEGQVVSATDGSGIAGAEVVFSFGEASLPARTDAEGRFEFAPRDAGTYLLSRAAADGYVAFSPEWGDSPITFALRAGERIHGVKVALRPDTACAGLVVDQAGKPVAGAKVSIWSGGRMTGASITTRDSDAQGRFEFHLSEPAVVEARHGEGQEARVGRAPADHSVFSQCQIRVRLGPPRQVPAVTIAGRVESLDGTPVTGVTLTAAADMVLEPNAFHAYARATAGEDGRFELGPVEPLPYRLAAYLGGREVALLREVRGGSRDVVVRIASAGRLRGHVRDGQTGTPVASFTIILTRPRGPLDIQTVGAFTHYDARGAFEIAGLPAGRYQAVAVAEALAPSEEQAAEVVPEPGPGPELTFELRAGGRIHGRVVDRASRQPIAGAKVAIEGGARSGMVPLATEVRSRADGGFELRGVGPGFLSLQVAGAGEHHGRVLGGLEMKPEGELGPVEVDLAPVKTGEKPRIEFVGIGAALTAKDGVIVMGQVTKDGAAAAAGLVPGDAILAVDGLPVAEVGFGRAIARIRGAEGTVVVLRVRRAANGAESDVHVTRRMAQNL